VQQSFLERDFTTTERVHLNRFAVPCGSDSAVQSLPQRHDTPSFDPLPSVLTPEKDLHVLTPTKTYSKTLVPSTVTPIPIHVHSPSTSFQMSAIKPSPSALVSDHGHRGYQTILVPTNQGEQLIDINCTLLLLGYHFKNRS
jgi:hypothetical protein